MASAAEQLRLEESGGLGLDSLDGSIFRVGNLRFCQGCRNLMYARAETDNLVWQCSIECPYSLHTSDMSDVMETESGSRVVVLSQTTDSDFTHSQNPHNDFTKYDPTLLRTNRVCPNIEAPEHSRSPTEPSEMIIFKQNVVTANSYYICTRCGKSISLDDQILHP